MLKRILLPIVVAVLASVTLPAQSAGTLDIATNKNLKYTPLIQEIVEKYGLDLDGDWNTAYMAHLGRYPNMYHEFVLQRMRQIDYEANGDQGLFILEHPELLRKSGWC